ncbi:LysR family transcriptional regulator [Aquibium sp. ELW1220]|uniref:LysR family transcriptional regulator n=1 Tax=Aquibium sp. ELW1220 TaxID=2976766 RepID=UPI0025B01EB1|nr:LysR family transcriptional regulator [Aquibium sp. ELW1220]MDN2581182.1 LysR family transcriptional regulator [Aquibium sp. ELW1220]
MPAFSRFSRYFEEVAKRGSIRSAAEILRIAPSAIDRQIILAEKELGVALFDRLPQGLRLTAAGEHLVYNLRRWRREYDAVKAEIDGIQGLQSGRITLAVAEAMGNELMATLVGTFHEKYPKIVISIHVVGAGGVREMVMSGHADLGLTYMPTAYRVMRVEHTIALTPGIAVLPDHPLAGKSSLRLRDCHELPVIMPEDGLRIRTCMDAALAATGVTLHPVATCNNFNLMKALVMQRVGVAVLTCAEVLSERRAGTLVFLPFADTEIAKLSLSLVTPSHPSSAALKMARGIVSAMEEMAETGLSKK